MPHSPTTNAQSHSGNTTIHVNQGENKGTINTYSNCNVYITNMTHSDGTQQATISQLEINLYQFDIKRFNYHSNLSLSALLEIYFAPLQSYYNVAHWLYGDKIVEDSGLVEYPLWQLRYAFLATIQWQSRFEKALKKAGHTNTQLKLSSEITVANVLSQIIAQENQSLSDYSEAIDSLRHLVCLFSENPGTHQISSLTYALSLLITLSLRDTSNENLREQILELLKENPVKLRLNVHNERYTTTKLRLLTTPLGSLKKKNKKQYKLRHLMFIDYRHTCWSGLDLDGIDFSGADLTGAFFVGSQNLTKARYCCFYKIHDRKLHLKESADLEGTWASSDIQSKQHLKHYFWGLSNLHQATLETDMPEKKKKLTQAAQLLKTTKKASFHKLFIFKMHLACLALLRNRPQEALNLLLTAWNLDAHTLNTLLNPKPGTPPHYLNLLGWDAFKEKLKEVITQKQLRRFYTQLSDIPLAKHHTRNEAHRATKTHEPTLEYATSPAEDSRRQSYLEFIQALWPNEITLYEDLCHHPNPYGYRQSERIAYETLAASIQRLCLLPQSDDEISHDTEEAHHDGALASIEITSLSVGNQRVLPSIIQQLIKYKLFDIDIGKFKPPQHPKTKQKDDAIKSQHRVIRIDCDSHGVYISSEPDVPRHSDKLEPGYVSIHLKIHPDLPMMDYTTDIFNRRLIGHGSPANEFVVLTITQKTKDNKPVYSKRYPALISQTVEGINLKKVLANPHSKQLEHLDNKSTSEFFIAEVLKHPGDGFSRNYFIKDNSRSQTYEIVSVDNSQMFVEPIVKKSLGHKKLYERSIIYCLPQIMQTPLETSVLEEIANIKDVGKLLTAWLNSVAGREKAYAKLFDKVIIKTWNDSRNKNNPFIPYTLFRPGAISLLAMQLRYLQSLFQMQKIQKEIISPTLVLEKLNPRVSYYYKQEQVDSNTLTSERQFKKATRAVKSMSSSKAVRAILGEVPSKEEILAQLNQLKQDKETKNKTYVQLAQVEITLLRRQLIADLKDKEILQIKEKGYWELCVDFQSSVQMKRFHQELWLDKLLLQNAKFSKLELSYCEGLDDVRLIALFKKSRQLRYLDITGCKRITEKSLRQLEEHCKSLEVLKASRTGIITTHGLQQKQPLSFPKLKRLHLAQCVFDQAEGQPKFLKQLKIKAPQLKYLKLNNNPSLTTLTILSEETRLIKLNISECKQLTDTEFNLDSRALVEAQLERCDKLTHRKFREAYPTFLTALEWQHYKKQFVQRFSGTLKEMLNGIKWVDLPYDLRKILHERLQLWGEIGNRLIPELLIALKENKSYSSYRVRLRATQALGLNNIHLSKHLDFVIPALLKALQDPTFEVREAALQALSQCHAHLGRYINKVIPALLIVLKKGDYYDEAYSALRKRAAQTLSQCISYTPESTINTLLILLQKDEYKDSVWLRNGARDSVFFRNGAALALGQCHTDLREYKDKIIPALIAALQEYKYHAYSFEVRYAAAQTLGKCVQHDSDNSIIPELLDALKKDNPLELQLEALEALGSCVRHQLDNIIPAILRAFREDNSKAVRAAAGQALRHCVAFAPDSIITELLKALKKYKSSWVRAEIARVLGMIGTGYTLQSWIKTAFNDNKVNLAKQLGTKQPSTEEALLYSSVFTNHVVTTLPSVPPSPDETTLNHLRMHWF